MYLVPLDGPRGIAAGGIAAGGIEAGGIRKEVNEKRNKKKKV